MAFDGRTDCHLGGRMKRKVHYTKSLSLLNSIARNQFDPSKSLVTHNGNTMIDSIFLLLGVPVVVTTFPIMKTQEHSNMKINPDGSSRDVCR
jgi:hypothetical protein